MTEETQPTKTERLPAEVRANMLSNETSIFFNVALYEQAQRVAQMFAASTMVPAHFRGNLGNCMIGLNYAARIQADPFMVLQSLYVVHGRPGIEGKLVEAVINQSAKYSEPLQYVWLDPDDNEVTRKEVLKAQVPSEYGCQAFTIDRKSGKRVDGPKITWELVKAEGWYDKKDKESGSLISKWRTMPEMMFYYRAASWFANKNCPELKLGMHTVEEIEDIIDLSKGRNGTYGTADLNEKLNGTPKTESPKTDPYATKKPEEEPERKKDDDKDPIRDQYNRLKETGFKKWVEAHKEHIPGLEQKYRDEIFSKWKKFYPHLDYPLAPTAVEPEPEIVDQDENASPKEVASTPIEDNMEKVLRLVKGAGKDSWGRLTVPCPNKGDRNIYAQNCDKCEMREGCPTYSAYDKEE
jgi:hypothetical protein